MKTMKRRAPKTTKRDKYDGKSVADLRALWDRMVTEGADTADLTVVSNAITAAEAREADTVKHSPAKIEAKRRVTIAATQVAERKRATKAKRDADKLTPAVFTVAIDGRPFATVRVVPALSVPGYEQHA